MRKIPFQQVGQGSKLGPSFDGPYRAERFLESEVVYSLVRMSDGYKVPRVHISQLKRYFGPAVDEPQLEIKSPARIQKKKSRTGNKKSPLSGPENRRPEMSESEWFYFGRSGDASHKHTPSRATGQEESIKTELSAPDSGTTKPLVSEIGGIPSQTFERIHVNETFTIPEVHDDSLTCTGLVVGHLMNNSFESVVIKIKFLLCRVYLSYPGVTCLCTL